LPETSSQKWPHAEGQHTQTRKGYENIEDHFPSIYPLWLFEGIGKILTGSVEGGEEEIAACLVGLLIACLEGCDAAVEVFEGVVCFVLEEGLK